MSISLDPGLWVSSIICIGIYSYLYKDNVFFRICESIIIGIITGHLVVMAIKSIADSSITPIMRGEVIYIIPIILGLLLFTKYIKKYAYISMYPLSILVGLGTGYAMRSIIQAQLIGQLKGVIKNLVVPGNAFGTLNNILIVIGVVCVVSFFIFTKEHKGILGNVATIGRWFMMFCFGATMSGKAMTFTPQVVTVWMNILVRLLGLG